MLKHHLLIRWPGVRGLFPPCAVGRHLRLRPGWPDLRRLHPPAASAGLQPASHHAGHSARSLRTRSRRLLPRLLRHPLRLRVCRTRPVCDEYGAVSVHFEHVLLAVHRAAGHQQNRQVDQGNASVGSDLFHLAHLRRPLRPLLHVPGESFSLLILYTMFQGRVSSSSLSSTSCPR